MEAQSCLYSWKIHAWCWVGNMQSCFLDLKGCCFGAQCSEEEAEVYGPYCLDQTQLKEKEM